MSNSTNLPRLPQHFLATTATFQSGLSQDNKPAGGARNTRDHLWNLSPNLHCSVVGTCLSTGDLRKFFAKLGDADARTASDHALHGRAVTAAGQADFAGKRLNKMLDKRHEAPIGRFAKAKTVEAVRQLWTEYLDRGDIPGAYWAVLTHPATDNELAKDVFGEVHMLSHLVGMSNRADIARLRHLEQALNERDEKIADQEERLHRAAQDKADLRARADQLETERRVRSEIRPVFDPAAPDDLAALTRKLADEQARSASLAQRVEEQNRDLKAAQQRTAEHEAQIVSLQTELASLEATLEGLVHPGEAVAEIRDLAGLTLLYVGGRPKLIEQLRALTARRGGHLLSHDGGVEEKASLLPGLVSQSDVAFFPADCVSHHAAGQVKRFCREAGKPFVPLRSASLASFIAATAKPSELIGPVSAG